MTLELDFVRDLAAPPEAVWPLLTDPDRMRRWSEAEVFAVAAGDEGRLDRIGALRQVYAPSPAGPVALLEVIEDAAPPHRLVYRVVRGPALVRAHRGEQTLEPRPGGGSRLSWRVSITLAVDNAGPALRRVLAPALERSLDALVVEARGAPAVACPAAREVLEPDLAPLRAEAAAIQAEQRAMALELAAEGSPHRAFARVYELVTEEQLAHLARGAVRHREWVLRLVPRFHAYYAPNLERWRAGRHLAVEGPWARSFRAAERGGTGGLVRGLVHGVRAHIEEDLPRALADVWLAHFSERCDYARFRGDYLAMEEIFGRATERFALELPKDAIPLWLRAARAVLPEGARVALSRGRGYDVDAARREAFERGGRLAAWKRGP